jgi:hypothetical protein
MAEKIELASFSIDVNALETNIAKLQDSIEKLKKEQLDLIKQGKQLDKAFADNVVSINKLEKSLNSHFRILSRVVEKSRELAGMNNLLQQQLTNETQIIINAATANDRLNQSMETGTTSTQNTAQAVDNLNEALEANVNASNDAITKQQAFDQIMARSANTITELQEQNKALVTLRDRVDSSTEEGAALLNELNKQINANVASIKARRSELQQELTLEERIEKALANEARGVKELRAQNSELIKIRNEIDHTTEEGQKQIALLNQRIDENTATIKSNVSQMEQQKMGIGDYANAIKDALGDMDLFNGQFDQMRGVFQAFGPVFGNLKNQFKEGFDSLKNLTAGTEGLTGAQKASAIASNLLSGSMKLLKVALIGTGIGAIVVLLGSLVAYLSSSEKASNKLGVILGKLGGIIAKLLDYLEPLGEFVLNVLIASFEKLGQIATKAIDDIANALEFLGFDKAAQGMKNFNKEMETAAKNAEHLTKLQQNLTEAQRKQGIMQLKYQQDAEKLRQIRDNENLTIAQRQKANEDLAALLKEQLAVEQRIAAQALEVANLRIKQDDATKENLDAQAEAMKAMLEITERITSQESEQLTNRVALQKEAAEQAKAAAEARIKQMQDELELFKLQGDGRAKSLEQQLELEQEYAQRQEKILKQQLKNRLITQTEFNIAMVTLANQLRERQAEIAQANLDYELSRIEDQSELELTMTKAKGLALVEEELRQAKIVADARAAYESQRFKKGLIDEQTYRDNALKIQHQFQLKEIELRKETDELLKERSAQNLEFAQERDRLALEARFANEWEIREQQIKQTRERDLAQARQTYTDQVMLDQAILNINQQAKNSEMILEKEKNEAIWQSRADLAGALSQLLGEETIAGKAAAIAQATINTYLGVTKALATLPPPASWIAAATTLATGLASVANITGITGGNTSIEVPSNPTESAPVAQEVVPLNAVPPFATGGKVVTGIPIKRSNGDDVLITARKGEIILNDKQQAALGGDATFRALGIKGYATGGVVGGTTVLPTVQNTILKQIDDTFAKTISDAVREGSQAGSRAGTRQGVDDATTSSLISRLSAS